MYYVGNMPYDPNYIEHFGILGMKWGIRRWQYKDGRYNEAGKLRYFGSPKRKQATKTKTDYDRKGSNSDNGDGKKRRYLDHDRINQEESSAVKKLRNNVKQNTEKAKRFQIDDATKKKIIIGAAVVGAIVVTGIAVHKIRNGDFHHTAKTGEEWLSGKGLSFIKTRGVNNSKVILEKGDQLHRMHGFADFDINKVDGNLYTSFLPEDVDTYKVALGDISKTGQRFDVTLEAITRIKSPGEKSRYKIFNNLLKKSPEFRKNLVESIAKDANMSVDDVLSKIISGDETAKDLYDYVNWSLVKPENKVGAEYAKEVMRLGYNAIFDDHDVTIAKKPLILLDPKNTISKVGERFVDSKDYIKTWFRFAKADNLLTKETGDIARDFRNMDFIKAKNETNKYVQLKNAIQRYVFTFKDKPLPTIGTPKADFAFDHLNPYMNSDDKRLVRIMKTLWRKVDNMDDIVINTYFPDIEPMSISELDKLFNEWGLHM